MVRSHYLLAPSVSLAEKFGSSEPFTEVKCALIRYSIRVWPCGTRVAVTFYHTYSAYACSHSGGNLVVIVSTLSVHRKIDISVLGMPVS